MRVRLNRQIGWQAMERERLTAELLAGRAAVRVRCRDGVEPCTSSGVAVAGRAQQFPCVAPRLVEVRVLRKFRHHISSTARRPACQARR
jgi:hypothetical protein